MLATGTDNSCKLSAYLNYGCITPRQVFAALQKEEGLQEGKDTLKMHLQIRFYPWHHLGILLLLGSSNIHSGLHVEDVYMTQ